MRRIAIAAALWWAGAAQAVTGVTQEQIHQAVEAYTRGQLEGKTDASERVEINVRWQGDIALDGDGKPEVLVRRLSGRPLRGPTVLRAEIRLAGRTERVMSVTADVRYFRPVLVATRNIRRGEKLLADLFEVQERDVTRLRDGYFDLDAVLEGMQARRPLGFNDILSRDHVQKIPVVRRGDVLSLVLEAGNMQITTRATALKAGGVGDRIRVRNADSGKILEGVVADARTVEVR